MKTGMTTQATIGVKVATNNPSNSPDPRKLRQRGKFSRSGDGFTEEAYQILAHGAISDGNYRQIGGGLCSLLEAGITYRIDGEEQRCRNRCRQGILITEDLRDAVITDEAATGILWEFIGDLRVVGQVPDYEAAYETAATIYRRNDMERAVGWSADPLVHPFNEFFLQLLDVTNFETNKSGGRAEFIKRVNYKMDNFPEIAEEAAIPENWRA